MTGRRYDDTPLPDDAGMPERDRPAMNKLGIWLRREVLVPMNVPHRSNFENTTITVEAVRDFIAVAREYAKMAKFPQVPMTEAFEELYFDVESQGQSIRLRVAGDGVAILLSIAANAFGRNPDGSLFFDPSAVIDLQAVLRAMAEAEAGAPEARPA